MKLPLKKHSGVKKDKQTSLVVKKGDSIHSSTFVTFDRSSYLSICVCVSLTDTQNLGLSKKLY